MTRRVEITEQQAIGLVLRELTAPIGTECPPHKFSAAWAATGAPSLGEDNTVPCIYCTTCGEVRALRVAE